MGVNKLVEGRIPLTTTGHLALRASNVSVTFRTRVDRDAARHQRGLRRWSRGQERVRNVKALCDVSVDFYGGEAVGLIGRNGAGKSTLLQALAGVLPVTEGSVHAVSKPLLLGVGAALQAKLSGRRNIVLGGLALGRTRQEIEAMSDEIIHFSGIGDSVDLPMNTYSSGMRARLQFAIATAVSPEILFVDEALSVGDEEFQERSRTRVRELVDDAGTVVIASHSTRTLMKMCERGIWVHAGELQAEGPIREVTAEYRRFIESSARTTGPGCS